jgi:DNA topoisomerase-2
MTEKYIKSDQISHVLLRPDTYVGSKAFKPSVEYIYEDEKLEKKRILISPALLRTFIEILANAVDNSIKYKGCKSIKIIVDSNECCIWNDGHVIPIEQHEEEGIYNHTLIFGHLLSSSNYNDNEKRFVSGRNGLGAKLTNIFSSKFSVEGADPDRGLRINQVWTNNMKTTQSPKISKYIKKTGYTLVKWVLDFTQFGIVEYPKDMLSLFKRYALDAAINTTAAVYFNGEKLPNTLLKYANLVNTTEESLTFSSKTSTAIVMPSDEFEVISFVNGINTKNGGVHVNAWVDAICKPIITKLKSGSVKDVKAHLRFIIIASVVNPTFDSQEKNYLEGPPIAVDPIKPSQITKIYTKWGIGERLKQQLEMKEKIKVSKTVSSAKRIPIPGYDRANNSGGGKSNECILIICEGLSAKTFAVAGIEHGLLGKRGRDWFGIYPLRGKLLNVRKAATKMIGANDVIKNLLLIMGLDYSKPEKIQKLNYGKICIIVDADDDGIHIKGLLLNFFHHLFPKFFEIPGTIVCMNTPILKVGKTFYYDENTTITDKGKAKYYKGLGTTKPEDVPQVFGKKMTEFVMDDNTSISLDLAFGKNGTTARKEWVCEFDPNYSNNGLDQSLKVWNKMTISKFVENDLVKFSYTDCMRSIPSLFDGLKESQRKVLYSAKKKNLISDLKVAQFAGYISEQTNYRHGEQNLFDTIIKMNQIFPGSNNISYFVPEGMFGTRLEGGKDAASPRYISTRLRDITNILFPQKDDIFFPQREDDKDLVEPYYYVPIIPTLLINGCMGIGTGWQSSVPCFSPNDIKENVLRWIDGDELLPLTPYYNGFSGEIKQVSPNKFETKGIYTINKNKVSVTELPIGLWTEKFKMWCEENSQITNIRNLSTPTKVDFMLTVKSEFDVEQFDKKLTTSLNTNNIVVLGRDDKIIKVTVNELFNLWGKERLAIYEKRRSTEIESLKKQEEELTAKIQFINMVKSKEIDLFNEEEVLIKLLSTKIKGIEAEKLLSLPVRTLTTEKKQKLEKMRQEVITSISKLEHLSACDIWKHELGKMNLP